MNGTALTPRMLTRTFTKAGTRRGRGRRRARRREGAAMFVVMLLLLIVTATATFAIHSTTTEIRSSGYSRQRMQTRYVAEGALVSGMALIEESGPEVLRVAMERSTGDALRGAAGPSRALAPEEPPMAADVGNHRIEVSDFVVGSRGVQTSPLEMTAGRESLGVGMGLTPDFVIDVNDQYRYTGVIAGQRSDGMGTLEYVAATYTARGMATPPADRYSPAGPSDPASPLRRGYHLTVSNARAIVISGPTRRR